MKFSEILLGTLLIGQSVLSSAQIVNIPDANFKNALVNTLCVPLDETSCDGFFPVDINGNGEIEVAEAEIVDHLCVAIQDIASLEGIQAFINLETLHVEYNNLTTIDVSQNVLLRELYVEGNSINSIDLSNLNLLNVLNVFDNNLTSLDVSNNSNLIRLFCSSNDLSSLDISQNPLLDTLNAGNNEIDAIDISQNLVLKILVINSNLIQSIDVSQNPDLIDISVSNNQITSLDVTNKPDLLKLVIQENPLKGSIDLSGSPLLNVLAVEETLIAELNIQNGNNENLATFRAFDTPNLFCIQVDNPVLAQSGAPPYDEWEIDAQAFYSEDCSLGVEEIDGNHIRMYPNPTGDLIHILSKKYELQKLSIFNIEGKQLLQLNEVPSQISLAQIPSGVLFVKVMTDQGVVTKKMIKN